MIVPMFQPIQCYTTNKLVAAEALVRWFSEGRYFGPGDMPDNIRWEDIDLQIIQQLSNSASIVEAVLPRVMINVSEETLQSDHHFAQWSDEVKRFQDRCGTSLAIEITEQVKTRTLQKRWKQLASLGTSILMDDYGYQLSSLDRLKAYPWDGCKFDAKKLATPAAREHQGDYQGLSYCFSKGIIAICEQVENEQLASQAAAHGLGWQQGFHYGKAGWLDGWVAEGEEEQVLAAAYS